MQDAQFQTLWAIFQSMLGVFLWPLIIAIILLTIFFWGLLLRDKRIVAKRFIHAQLFGLFGGIVGLWVMTLLSESRFTDAGGPLDWLLVVAIYVFAAIGSAILYYTVSGWLRPKPSPYTSSKQ